MEDNSMSICIVMPPINTSAEASSKEIIAIGDANEICVAMPPTITSAEVIGDARTRRRIKKCLCVKIIHYYIIVMAILGVTLAIYLRITRKYPIFQVVTMVIGLIFAIWIYVEDDLIYYINSATDSDERVGDVTKSKLEEFIESLPFYLHISFIISIICLVVELKLSHRH
ncbi:hypothetical protein OROGR_025154 [Orobanche gracilis]